MLYVVQHILGCNACRMLKVAKNQGCFLIKKVLPLRPQNSRRVKATVKQ